MIRTMRIGASRPMHGSGQSRVVESVRHQIAPNKDNDFPFTLTGDDRKPGTQLTLRVVPVIGTAQPASRSLELQWRTAGVSGQGRAPVQDGRRSRWPTTAEATRPGSSTVGMWPAPGMRSSREPGTSRS